MQVRLRSGVPGVRLGRVFLRLGGAWVGVDRAGVGGMGQAASRQQAEGRTHPVGPVRSDSPDSADPSGLPGWGGRASGVNAVVGAGPVHVCALLRCAVRWGAWGGFQGCASYTSYSSYTISVLVLGTAGQLQRQLHGGYV